MASLYESLSPIIFVLHRCRSHHCKIITACVEYFESLIFVSQKLLISVTVLVIVNTGHSHCSIVRCVQFGDWNQRRPPSIPTRRRWWKARPRPVPGRPRHHGDVDDRLPGHRTSGSSFYSCYTVPNTVLDIFAGLTVMRESSNWSIPSRCRDSGDSTRNVLRWTTRPWDELLGTVLSPAL